jgi:hypothetical protein
MFVSEYPAKNKLQFGAIMVFWRVFSSNYRHLKLIIAGY